MQVPFIDLTREYEAISEDIDRALEDVLTSGNFIMGEQVQQFESEFSNYIGSDYGIGVNSGSDALELALRALDIGPGDEVVTVSHTFISTANAIVKNGARPVFVDIDPETFCMDPSAVQEAITEDTAAILPVHLYGHPVEMDPLVDLAEDHDLAIVEDASQAHGAEYRDRPVGAIGDVGCFSLYPTKNLGAYGDAGIVVTDDPKLNSKMRSLRNYGRTDKYRHTRVENHSRLDEVQAALLREKLTYLDEWNERRRLAADKYREHLAGSSARPQSISNDAEHVFHLFVIRHPRRDRLQESLEENGISSIIHYPVPVHQQPAYDDHEPRHPLRTTEQVVSEVVSLPIHPWIREEEIRAVANSVNLFDNLV